MYNSQSMVSKKRKYGDYTTEIDGKKYAVARIPLGGGRYKKKVKLLASIGGTKRDAQKWVWQQLDGETETVSTFAALAEWYSREYLVAPMYQDGKRIYGLRTWQHQRTVLERLSLYFGQYKLSNVTLDVLRRYKRHRLETVGMVSVNREFALMRTMFRKAKMRKWVRESPFELGELIEISLESPRVTELDTKLAVRLLARSRKSEQPLLHYLIYVLMFTGARPSEIYPFNVPAADEVIREPLTWDRILKFDFKAIEIVSYKGRIRKVRIVPTTAGLERSLRSLYALAEHGPSDLVFPVKSFKRSWATLCRSVGVSGVWLRDFRHYYNSVILQRTDINDVERMILMGHTQVRTNIRYSKLGLEFIEKYRDGFSSS